MFLISGDKTFAVVKVLSPQKISHAKLIIYNDAIDVVHFIMCS